MSFYNSESLLLLASSSPFSVEENQTSIPKTTTNVPQYKLLDFTSFSTRAQNSEDQQTFACGSIRSVNAGQTSNGQTLVDLCFW